MNSFSFQINQRYCFKSNLKSRNSILRCNKIPLKQKNFSNELSLVDLRIQLHENLQYRECNIVITVKASSDINLKYI